MPEHFGYWTVLKEGERGKKGSHPTVIVQCRCGEIRERSIYDLRYGKTKSCGCWRRETIAKRHRTHGESHKTAEYRAWKEMRGRCYRRTNTSYVWYGARGIRVCRRWVKYENFLADMGRKPKNTSLERRNNDGHYTPTNCYWASNAQQARNKRTNRWLTHRGVTLTITDWARRLGVDLATLQYRLSRNWPPDDVFSSRRHAGKSRIAGRKKKG